MENLLLDQVAFLRIIQAFGLGFLSSLTPCVFPLIPVTLAIFGATEARSRREGFLLGASYVMGIALTYTALGVISARMGIVFGAFLGNLWVIVFLNLFLILVLLHTLEILQFNFLSALQTKAGSVGGKGVAGAFLMGSVSGLIAAPCVGPALVIILSLAAQSQSSTWGALLLFSYSLGLGIIFLVLATFSSLVNKLPKSGAWLNSIKFILASLLVVLIIFLSQRYLRSLTDLFSLENYAGTLMILSNLSILLAWYSYKHNKKILRVFASVIMGFCVFQFFIHESSIQASGKPDAQIWQSNLAGALDQAKLEQKITILDLYADWCAACKEFERITFADSRVQASLKEFVTVRLDLTDTTTPEAMILTARYQVPGLPLILFLKPDGSGDEIADSRITGFLGPSEFIKHLELVKD